MSMDVGSAEPDDAATRPIVLLLMLALFTTALAYSAVLPVLPAILQQAGLSRAATSWHTGLLTGVYMLTVFLFAPAWGRSSDRLGRRAIIVLGLGGMAVALLGFALFHGIVLAYAARALTGVFVAAVIPVGTAEIGDISGTASRAHRFALLTSASLLGFLAGPSLSGRLANDPWLRTLLTPSLSLYVPVIVAAVLSGCTAVAVGVWLPPTDPRRTVPDGEQRRAFSLTRAAPAVLVLIVMFALASFEVAITLRGQQRLGWTVAQIGVLFAECSAVMILIQGFLFSLLIKRVPSGWLLGPGIVAMVIGLVLMPMTANYDRILLLVMLISAGASVIAPMITYWASIGAGLAQGAALGAQTAASSLGQALGSAVVGALFGFSAAAPFWIAAALLLVGGAIVFAPASGAFLRPARL